MLILRVPFHIPNYSLLILLLLVVLLTACKHSNIQKRFRSLSSSNTNITFKNTIAETENFNILNFHYIYNGGGVGVGDFDKNGLPDLVFTGNQVASELYLNQGNLQFNNISTAANFTPTGWITGVSIIDLNQDGWDDIYLSVGGLDCDGNCNNQLFIHQGLDENGVPTFVEKAAEYGLEDGLYTQQAVFFDHDLDGDLDVYLLHNVIDRRDKNAPSQKKFINQKSADQLLINNGKNQFTDASELFKIDQRGYGLGVTLNDFNQDGFPDLYVANDFLSDDLIYISQVNTKNEITHYDEMGKTYLKHQSYNSMGVDIADLNNDGLSEICVLDMLPETHERLKNMQGFMNYDKFLLTLRNGYAPQFVRNVLQLNSGFLNGEQLPFSEVGYMVGMHATDWSWTPLLADFDNDGDRDLYVTNGYGKDITDLDFINYSSELGNFGTKTERNRQLFQKIQQMPSVEIPNYFYENEISHAYLKDTKINGVPNDAPQFTDRSNEWIDQENSISNGATYADLDNDGDLDIITNNINQTAFILENQTHQQNEKQTNYLKINLTGAQAFLPVNTGAQVSQPVNEPRKTKTTIGTKIYLWADGESQYHYHSPVRGYLSSTDPTVHFGLAATEKVDSITVIFPGGKVRKLQNIAANQTLEIDQNVQLDTIYRADNLQLKNWTNKPFFAQSDLLNFQNFSLWSRERLANLVHVENPYQDYDAQPLLLTQHSRQGPCLAVANVDGKPGDELFIGGAKGYPSRIYFPQSKESLPFKTLTDSTSEDTAATFFDVDNDGDLDLYVVSGGTEFKQNAPEFTDRLYLNNGQGDFTQVTDIQLPTSSGGCVIAIDYDNDGDTDLFVGGRVEPRQYPAAPPSYLLVNENGRLVDKTAELAKPLQNIGMVTDAVWSDYDGDGWQDLVVVGEWMPITILRNENGIFKTANKIEIENSTGLWNCIAAADLDEDGDPDYLVGNLGLNSRLQASTDEPLALYTTDFDQNGSPDPFVGKYYKNKDNGYKLYPIHARDDVVRQVTKVKANYVKYADFGRADFNQMLQFATDPQALIHAPQLQSCWVQNEGEHYFGLQALPMAAQVAPVQDILIDDVNGDDHWDALFIGNDYAAEKNGGWYDAFNGVVLIGYGTGAFEPYAAAESGFFVPNDGRSLVKMQGENGAAIYVVGQNRGAFKVFEKTEK